jgi:thiamine-monophosphate kinase
VLPGPGGKDLLVTTDMMIEDVHFRRADPPGVVGYRALGRGLSDIAAMGGSPRWCLLSLALAPWTSTAWIKRFFDGLLALAKRHRTLLVGGDISHSRQATADIVVMGEAPRGKALLRSRARPGDGIYVSGVLGGAPIKFEPRIELGRFLRARATACMDLSDGLSLDLHRLCAESGVSAVIDRPLPVAHGATMEQALHAGEDYELLFTARRELPRFHRGLPITRVGTIVRGPAGRIELFGRPHLPRGYDHLKRSPKRP